MSERAAYYVVASMLALAGLVAVVAGIVYVSTPARSLPSFMPGHLNGVRIKRSYRGHVAIELGILVIVVGVAIGAYARWRH